MKGGGGLARACSRETNTQMNAADGALQQKQLETPSKKRAGEQ